MHIITIHIACNLSSEVRFASFLSGGFTTTMAVINPPERKLAKRTSVKCRTLVGMEIQKKPKKAKRAKTKVLENPQK